MPENESSLWHIRFHFYPQKFSQVWNCLKEVGWQHRAPKYISPEGRVFSNSNDVCAYLDEYALPEIYSNLQSSEVFESSSEGFQTRIKVLEEWKKRYGMESYVNETTTLSSLYGNSARDTVDNDTQERHGNQHNQRNQSTTVADKGSNMYLHRATKERKSKITKNTALSSPSTLLTPSIQDCIKSIQRYDLHDVIEREDNCTIENFADWRFLLSTNHSILVYGMGSKRVLLERFAKEALEKEGSTLILDACDKNISIDGILDVLSMLFLKNKEPETMSAMMLEDAPEIHIAGQLTPWRATPTTERAILIGRAIARRVQETMQPVFLVIHNVEGLDQDTHDCLGYLLVNSCAPNGVHSIRLVASVDHVDAMLLLWGVQTAANLAWVYRQVHTYRPYTNELHLIPEDVSKRKAQAIQRKHDSRDAVVADVLSSLTPRHGEILQCLARLQQRNDWVAYKDFRHETRQAALIASDSQLKAVLTELSEHGMVVSKKDGNNESLQIPYSVSKVREILSLKFRL